MRAMVNESIWRPEPLPVAEPIQPFLAEPGSLTARLMATGHQFAVTVVQQGEDLALADELALFGLDSPAPLLARQVALTLDGTPVVVARSLSRPACPVWTPVLDRGNRSLGLTLFGDSTPIVREPLQFATLHEGHRLHALARQHDPRAAAAYPARRSRFLLEGKALTVCEVFLPALETFLS